MNQKELSKTFVMIQIEINLCSLWLYKNNLVFKGLTMSFLLVTSLLR